MVCCSRFHVSQVLLKILTGRRYHSLGCEPLHSPHHLLLATPLPGPWVRDLCLGSLHRLVAPRFSDESEMLYRGAETSDGRASASERNRYPEQSIQDLPDTRNNQRPRHLVLYYAADYINSCHWWSGSVLQPHHCVFWFQCPRDAVIEHCSGCGDDSGDGRWCCSGSDNWANYPSDACLECVGLHCRTTVFQT